MQDADQQRPYYGRELVGFAGVSYKSDASQPAWGEWMCAGTSATSSDQIIKPPRRWDTRKTYPYNKSPSIVGTPLVCVLQACAPNIHDSCLLCR